MIFIDDNKAVLDEVSNSGLLLRLKSLRHIINQSDVELKAMVTCSDAFSSSSGRLYLTLRC